MLPGFFLFDRHGMMYSIYREGERDERMDS